MDNKLLLALAAYAFLALMAWRTLENANIRLGTIAFLVLLALKTVLHFYREQQETGLNKG